MIFFRPSKSEPPCKRSGLAFFLHQPWSGSASQTPWSAGQHNRAGSKAQPRIRNTPEQNWLQSQILHFRGHSSNWGLCFNPQNILWYPGRLLEIVERWLWDRGTMKKRSLELLLTLCGACTVRRQSRAALGPEELQGNFPVGLWAWNSPLQHPSLHGQKWDQCLTTQDDFHFVMTFISRWLIVVDFLLWNFVAAQQEWKSGHSPQSPSNTSETGICCRAAVQLSQQIQ